MKIEINLLTVEDGQPKEIELFGKIFTIQEKRQVLHMPTIKVIPISKSYSSDIPDRGNVLTRLGHNAIHENVLRDFKDAVEHNRSVKSVFKKYSPKLSRGTIKSYTSLYKRYCREFENTKIITSAKKRRIRGKKYKKTPPAGTYGYSKTYQTYIKDTEVGNVMRAIQTVRYNYKPTSENIAQETNMTRSRTLATLSLLQAQDKIGYKTTKLTPIYFVK